jgi:hypothetical protein
VYSVVAFLLSIAVEFPRLIGVFLLVVGRRQLAVVSGPRRRYWWLVLD